MNAIRPLVLALVVAGGLMVPTQEAQARFVHAGLGSGACKASNGANSNLYYSLYAVKNVSGALQYVTCNTDFIREYLVNLKPGAGYKLTMLIGSTSTVPQTVTCTASVGSGGNAGVQSTKTVTTVSGAPGRFDFSTTELRASSDLDSLAVQCGLKPATSIGLFVSTQPEINVLLP